MIYIGLKAHGWTVATMQLTYISSVIGTHLANCLTACGESYALGSRLQIYSPPSLLCYMAVRPAKSNSSPHLNIKTFSLMGESWGNVGFCKMN